MGGKRPILVKLAKSALTAALTITIALVTTAVGAQPVAMENVAFGYQRPIPLMSSIGTEAVPTVRIIRGIGGVAFVREAAGADGWAVTNMQYDPSAGDGQRLKVTMAQHGGSPVTVRPQLWDWELVPLARFVQSNYDSAFTYFGELPEGVSSTIPYARIVSYHPELKDTLLGLRMMQLDLFLFQAPFAGYFTDAAGSVILGAGERSTFGENVDPASKTAIRAQREEISSRVDKAMAYLLEDCSKHTSTTCLRGFQPFSSYIIGDMISPTEFKVENGELSFQDRGLCWDFSRDADPGEESTPGLDDIVLLRSLSEAFCAKVRDELHGIHPVVYRAGTRAMRYAALMRHYKKRDPAGYAKLVMSLQGVDIGPTVSTPTEVAIEGDVAQEDMERVLEMLRGLPR